MFVKHIIFIAIFVMASTVLGAACFSCAQVDVPRMSCCEPPADCYGHDLLSDCPPVPQAVAFEAGPSDPAPWIALKGHNAAPHKTRTTIEAPAPGWRGIGHRRQQALLSVFLI